MDRFFKTCLRGRISSFMCTLSRVLNFRDFNEQIETGA